MCIVLDACCADSITNPELPQSGLVLEWIRKGGRVVSGGKLQKELGATSLRPLLVQWSLSGRLVTLSESDILVEEAAIKKLNLQSNDAHVLAVTRLSGARVVVTRDKPLMTDLKDRALMGDRRKIFPMPPQPAVDLRIGRAVLRSAQCSQD
jgi:predicted nucleic acid-binding protein